MRETKEREIDGTRFRVTQLGALKATDLFVRLMQVLGPTLGEAVGSGAQVDPGKLIASLAMNLRSEDIAYMRDTLGLVSEVHVGARAQDDAWRPMHSRETYDEVFAGRMMLQIRWLTFALEVQFADFFGDGGFLRAAAPQSLPGA
jgi:hypothetical protein